MRRFPLKGVGTLLLKCAAVPVVLGGLSLSVPGVAREGPVLVVANADTVTRHINYADLDLASLTGKSALNRRLGGAINSLCLETTGGGTFSFLPNVETRKCQASAWSQADPQVAQAV